MKTVVTGCAGFIGSHLAGYLLDQGHEVTGIDCLRAGRGDIGRVDQRADFREHDIRDPGAAYCLAGADWVFHLAAVSTTPWAVSEPLEANDINVNGTLNLLDGAQRAGVSRFVYSSSNVVYGAPTAYRASKLAAESYAGVWSHLYGLPAVSLRYANVIGSLRQNEENCIMSMRASARRDGYVWVTGDGTQSRGFIDVRDACRANLLAARSDYAGPPLDICTGTHHDMNEIAGRFGVPVRHVGDRRGDIKHIRQDPAAAMTAIGFTAQVSFAESMGVYLA